MIQMRFALIQYTRYEKGNELAPQQIAKSIRIYTDRGQNSSWVRQTPEMPIIYQIIVIYESVIRVITCLINHCIPASTECNDHFCILHIDPPRVDLCFHRCIAAAPSLYHSTF